MNRLTNEATENTNKVTSNQPDKCTNNKLTNDHIRKRQTNKQTHTHTHISKQAHEQASTEPKHTTHKRISKQLANRHTHTQVKQ